MNFKFSLLRNSSSRAVGSLLRAGVGSETLWWQEEMVCAEPAGGAQAGGD